MECQQPVMSVLGFKRCPCVPLRGLRFVPMCGRLLVGKSKLHVAALVGAAMLILLASAMAATLVGFRASNAVSQGASTAPTSLALMCRWRSRPQPRSGSGIRDRQIHRRLASSARSAQSLRSPKQRMQIAPPVRTKPTLHSCLNGPRASILIAGRRLVPAIASLSLFVAVLE